MLLEWGLFILCYVTFFFFICGHTVSLSEPYSVKSHCVCVCVVPAETHSSAQRGAPEAAVPRRSGARLRRVLGAQRVSHPQRAAQSGRREARQQPGQPLQRGPAISLQPPHLPQTLTNISFRKDLTASEHKPPLCQYLYVKI